MELQGAMEFASPLPIDAALPELTAALRTRNTAVLVAPPGAGKTTRVPLALRTRALGDKRRRILVLEPRRLAARAAAERMAKTLGERVGETVGLRVRLRLEGLGPHADRDRHRGRVHPALLDDPLLEGVAAVLFDEFHERSLDADLGLALARDVQQGLREDLRLLVMSATLDGARVAKLLGDAPVIAARRPRLPGGDALSRPRRARRSSRKWRDAIARALRADRGLGARVPAGRGGDPPHRRATGRHGLDAAYRRRRRSMARSRATSRTAPSPQPRRAGARSCWRPPSPRPRSPSRACAS